MLNIIRSSLTAKLLLALTLITVVLLGSGITLISSRINNDVRELSLQTGKQIGKRYAAEMETTMGASLQVARDLSAVVSAMAAAGVTDREAYNRVLEETLKGNGGLFGTWIGFEPNALDQRDKDFVGKPGSDATGRFVSYWSRGGKDDAITLEALVDYEDPVAGLYYQSPKKNGHEVIVEPYSYPVNGKDVLMTSIGVPIKVNGKFIGVAGVDLKLDKLWTILKAYRPYDTGTMYLISNQGNWAAFESPEALTKPVVDTNPQLKDALSAVRGGQEWGAEGFSVVTKQDVYRLLVPVRLGNTGTPWSVLVQLPTDKMMETATALRQGSLVAGAALCAVLAVVLGIAASRMIGRPLAATVKSVEALSGGNLNVDIAQDGRLDEIGRLNDALAVFKRNAQEMEQLRIDNEQQKHEAEAKRRKSMMAVADEFERSVKALVDQMGTAARQMQTEAVSMTDMANQSTDRASAVAAAAEQASANVQTVAAASEQLSCSIGEIGQRVTQATTVANQAVNQSRSTGTIVSSLVESASRINEVVTLINDIAAQTNLLALNATIEAARAGEAGKGFAVVAGEVKALATQTERATGEIRQQVTSVQQAATQAVTAIEEIAATIDAINEISSTIAAAVEEQSSATQEISRNVDEAAKGTREVTTNIISVNDTVGQVGSMADKVLNASGMVAQQADSLNGQIERFVAGIRAG